ncbi:hypothetical protein ACT3TB_05430 [Micrococcaceae sp. AOP34-BR2-30]
MFAITMLAISAINLEARKLLAAADGASSAAATEFTAEVNSSELVPVLTQTKARDSVTTHLQDTSAYSQFENLGVGAVVIASGGDTVSVQLRATSRPPVVSWFMPDGITVQAESSARTNLER